MSMLASIDTLLKRPHIQITYIMIVEAPHCRRQGVHALDVPAYIAVRNLLGIISMLSSRFGAGR
jgi:hypothetical protein